MAKQSKRWTKRENWSLLWLIKKTLHCFYRCSRVQSKDGGVLHLPAFLQPGENPVCVGDGEGEREEQQGDSAEGDKQGCFPPAARAAGTGVRSETGRNKKEIGSRVFVNVGHYSHIFFQLELAVCLRKKGSKRLKGNICGRQELPRPPLSLCWWPTTHFLVLVVEKLWFCVKWVHWGCIQTPNIHAMQWVCHVSCLWPMSCVCAARLRGSTACTTPGVAQVTVRITATATNMHMHMHMHRRVRLSDPVMLPGFQLLC